MTRVSLGSVISDGSILGGGEFKIVLCGLLLIVC